MISKVWEVMNDLEMITSKIVSAREIIDTAAEAIQKNDYDKAETLAMAAYEFLGYYLDEFDTKFKLAWQETVVKQKKEENDFGMKPWGHSDLEYLSQQNTEKMWDIHNQTVRSTMSCDRDDPSPECKGAWNSFWEDSYHQDSMISRNDPTRLKYESGWIYESPNGGKTITKRKVGSTEKITVKEDKVVKWQLPVEMHPSGEAFVIFPDDLLEAANLRTSRIL